MRLTDTEGQTISENFYWRSKKGQNFQALSQLPLVKPNVDLKDEINGESAFSVKLKTESDQIALFIKGKIIDPTTELTVLPLVYSDNYFSLTPHSENMSHPEFL